MRAILLARATVTSIFGLRASICAGHDPFGAPCRLACCTTVLAPMINRRRIVRSPRFETAPSFCLPPVDFSVGMSPSQAAKARPRFVMFKPTAVQAILGAVMLRPGWMKRYVSTEQRDAARPLLTAFGFVWAALMFLLAGLNALLVVAVDPLTWAQFHLFVPPISMIVLFLIQNVYMRMAAARYRPD